MHLHSYRFCANPKATLLAAVLFLAVSCAEKAPPRSETKLAIRGEVNKPLSLTVEDLRSFPSFQLSRISLLEEKKNPSDPEKLVSEAAYRGVLLRDLLERAEIKHTRKWEPGVFVHVRGTNGKEDVFSFGEIFYSSIGRSILLATERDGKQVTAPDGIGQLIVSTDLRGGRWMTGVREIQVERVDVELKAYEDQSNSIVRSPSSSLALKDASGKNEEIRLQHLQVLPSLHVPAAVMVGECEGMRGVFSFDGCKLSDLLAAHGARWGEGASGHYVVVRSEDGFCATFSFGELFNSRLDNNIVIAYMKNGKLLGPDDAIAMSVAAEDSTGGRSVRRISDIEVR